MLGAGGVVGSGSGIVVGIGSLGIEGVGSSVGGGVGIISASIGGLAGGPPAGTDVVEVWLVVVSCCGSIKFLIF